MAEPFLAEIRIMSFGFPPKGWALCDGQLLPINQNQALFSLLGTTYGGDGRVNFAPAGPPGAASRCTWAADTPSASAAASRGTRSRSPRSRRTRTSRGCVDPRPPAESATPTGAVLGGANNAYHAPTNLTSLTPGTLANVGGSQAHLNMQPFLVLNFSIALQGIFPSQT